MPRPRWTTRTWLYAILLVALALAGGRFVLEVLESGGEPFAAGRTTARGWVVGRPPRIVVDVFAGHIRVFPGLDGRVTAEVDSGALCGPTRRAVHRALETIEMAMEQDGEQIRIVTGSAPEREVAKRTDVVLTVPPGVRLDLRTGRGNIRVGRDWDYSWKAPVHRPVTAASVRARNASPYHMGYEEGNILVETTAPRDESGTPTPTNLWLDACVSIEILADLAIVEAHAWHGRSRPSYSHTVCGKLDEAILSFEGGLAAGTHTLRAAHRIAVKLAEGPPLRVSAEAVGGPIGGTLLPGPVEPVEGRSRWEGATGPEPRGTLRLRTDDGSITLNARLGASGD